MILNQKMMFIIIHDSCLFQVIFYVEVWDIGRLGLKSITQKPCRSHMLSRAKIPVKRRTGPWVGVMTVMTVMTVMREGVDV